MSFHVNDLNDTQFEEFCFDILKSLDFVNLRWRKGTGLSSSPSDQGRDIEGELLRKDIDGSAHRERWFVECKHYTKGVPPDRIQNAISWANAERPDVLLIIASNFLSNPTKNYLEAYQEKHRPSYRIKIWELKDLENLTAGRNDLRRRYGLPTDVALISILNNYHVVYSMKPQLNTIEYLVELMDRLDPKKRDEAFAMTYFDVINPRFREPISGEETLGELMTDAVDYGAFRATCLSLKSTTSPSFVHRLVSSALAWMFHAADKTSLPEAESKLKSLIEHAESELAAADDDQRQFLVKMRDRTKEHLEKLPARLNHGYKVYTYICEELVQKLLTEKPPRLSHASMSSRSISEK
jgi:hypothetical protein